MIIFSLPYLRRRFFQRFILAALIVAVLFVSGRPASLPALAGEPGLWVELQAIGSLGGSASALVANGNIAYVGEGSQLVVLNLEPVQPEKILALPLAGIPQDMKIVDNRLYVAAGRAGLLIFNIAAPPAPVLLGSAGLPAAYSVAIEGTTAYIANDKSLEVVDVSDPSRPVSLASIETPGEARGVYIAAGRAYVADGEAGLVIFDIQNPANPIPLGLADTTGTAVDVVVRDGRAYVADSQDGLQIIDVSDPTLPNLLVTLETVFTGHLALSGSWLFLTSDFGNSLQVVDIALPDEPALVGEIALGGETLDVEISGAQALVTTGGGIKVVDVHDPLAMQIVKSYDMLSFPWEMDLEGNLLFLANERTGLWVASVSNPADPVLIGHLGLQVEPFGLDVTGGRAYVAHDRGLEVIDVSNPEQPLAVSSTALPGEPSDVQVVDRLAFVAQYSQGLTILDLTDPAHPLVAGSFVSETLAVEGLAVAGSYAYLADQHKGLLVLDVSLHTAPRLVSSFSTSSAAHGVLVRQGLAYVTTDDGLQIIDVQDPPHPVAVASLPVGRSRGLTAFGERLYVTGTRGVRVIQISDPGHLWVVDTYAVPGHAYGVAVTSDIVYVADVPGGLQILRQVPAPSLTLNYASGKPGSFFSLRGANFPAYYQATLTVNGTLLGKVQTGPGGQFTVNLDTAQAPAGQYVITTHINTRQVWTSLLLVDVAPLRENEGSAGILVFPEGVPAVVPLYLPASWQGE